MHGRRRVTENKASTWGKAEPGWQVALWAKLTAEGKAVLRRRDALAAIAKARKKKAQTTAPAG